MKVRYTDSALRDLDEIFAYIAERNRPAATAVANRIRQLAALIGEYPFLTHDIPTNQACGLRHSSAIRF